MTEVRTPTRSLDEADRLEVSGGRGKYTSLGYRSARVARLNGRSYPEGSADLHLEYDRASLLAQSRAFYRDNPVYIGVIDRAVSYIIGRGFGLRVLTPDIEKNQKIELAWRNWNRMPDIRGRYTGTEGAKTVCRETMLCGDTGCVKRDGGLVQYVEAEQITTGNQSQSGIKLDADGKAISYSVCAYAKGGRISPTNKREIDAKDFLFICGPGRPSQTRGAPVLQTSFAMIHRINDICDSEALARQLLSRIVLTITRDEAETRAYGESVADPNKPAANDTGDIARRLMEVDYGIFYHARPGEKVAGVERNIPGADFPSTLKAFMGMVGLAFGMPRELVQLDWSDANYSVSRAILEQAYQVFCDWQEIIEAFYYDPLFRWQRPALLKKAGYKDDGQDLLTEWIVPTFPWIDQLKEAQANGVKLDRCLTTHAHILKALGLDREDVVAARRLEILDAIQKAEGIEAETGVLVPWQLFCGLEVPKTAAPAPVETSSGTSSGDSVSDSQEKDDE